MLPHHIVAGPASSPPWVLLHGFPFSLEQWRPQIDALSARRHVVAWDMRGHGATPPGDDPLSIEFLVDDLIELLDHLEIDRACLCGLSMGGYVALRAVDRHPDRVMGLVLADTRAGQDDNAARVKRADGIRAIRKSGMKAFADKMLPALFPAAALDPPSAAVKTIRQQIEATDPNGAVQALAAMAARLDLRERLSAIDTPTLVVVGEHDGLTPPKDARELASGIAGATLVEIKGAGHVSNLDDPAAFNDALAAFAKRLPLA